MRAFVADVAVGHLFARGSLAVAHAPVMVREDGALWFHLARGNVLSEALVDGAEAVASVAEPGHYVSANWYADPRANVPTWNYRAVEVAGTVRRLGQAELVEQLDALSVAHEARVCEDWSRGKMEPARFEAMCAAIIGFALEGAVWRGTLKASQNKAAGERANVAAGLRGVGAEAAARRIEGRE